MKRCPRCSFIYEDDQRLCDLDGGELVLASGMLPPPEIAAPQQTVPPAKSRRSGSLFLPLAGVALAAVLVSIYYLIPQRPTLRATDQSSPATLAVTPQPDLNVVQSPTPVAPTRPNAQALAPSVSNQKAMVRAVAPPSRPKVAPRQPPAKPEVKTTQPEAASPGKESKFGSILKKTGRLLKKPFKF